MTGIALLHDMKSPTKIHQTPPRQESSPIDFEKWARKSDTFEQEKLKPNK